MCMRHTDALFSVQTAQLRIVANDGVGICLAFVLLQLRGLLTVWLNALPNIPTMNCV